MTQYIDKDALDTVLRKFWKEDNGLGNTTRYTYNEALQDIQCEIDTIEVKEVDLEEEFNNFLDDVEGTPRMWHSDEQIEWGKDIAKHFFELGLKAQKGE